MTSLLRRQFLLSCGACAAATWLPGAQAAERFDLIIRGGEVIDPSQGLRERRDISIR
jgi:dihydroorotase